MGVSRDEGDAMKIRIEVDNSIEETELILRCRELDGEVLDIQKNLQEMVSKGRQLVVFRNEVEYYLTLEEILFFETTPTFVAVHTKDQIYGCKYKLYELEELLPGSFMRVSKSTIISVNQLRAIHKNITGASEVEFAQSNKKAFVSRSYYKALEIKLEEKRLSR